MTNAYEDYVVLYTYTEEGGFVPNPDVDIRAELEDQVENCPVARRCFARLILAVCDLAEKGAFGPVPKAGNPRPVASAPSGDC